MGFRTETFTFESSVSVTSDAPPEAVYETVANLPAHLEWSGERASDENFKLLTLEAPEGRATDGTTFTSTGANFNGTFHDRSTVVETSPPLVASSSRRSLGWIASEGHRGRFSSCTATTSNLAAKVPPSCTRIRPDT